MQGTHNVAHDATFMVLYIGFSVAMVTASVVLVALLNMGVEFGATHVAASAINILGWSILPFMPAQRRARR